MQILAKFLGVLLLSVGCLVNARISDQRLCADEKCSVPVSIARSVLSYNSDDARILSFKPSETITVYSKSAGSRPDLWGVEIRGKRGYVPKDFLREQKILHSNLKHVVPTELAEDEASKKEEMAVEAEPLSNFEAKTEQPFAPTPLPGSAEENTDDPNVIVVDGTTIYMPEDADIQKTVTQTEPTTVSPPQPASMPPSPPPPDTIPPSPPTQPVQPEVKELQDSSEQTDVPPADVAAAPEHTTPTPEAPPAELDGASKEMDDGSIEAASEPPEIQNEDSVMGYLSDTLTGWIESSGEKEEVDNSLEDNMSDESSEVKDEVVETSTEKANAEPPEVIEEVDLSKINLLSLKGGPLEPPTSAEAPEEKSENPEKVSDDPPPIEDILPFAPQMIPAEPSADSIPSPYPGEPSSEEVFTSTALPPEEVSATSEESVFKPDDIPSSTKETQPAGETHEHKTVMTIDELFSTLGDPPPREEVVTTEAPTAEEAPPVEESPQPTEQVPPVEEPPAVEEVTQPPPPQEEPTPVPVEIETPSVGHPGEATLVSSPADHMYDPYTNVETGQGYDVSTPAPVEDDVPPPQDEETTTPYTPVEEPPTEKLEDQPEEETVTEESRDSGGIFADWVYNLFGSSGSSETEPSPSELEMLMSEPTPAEEEAAASTGSWFWSTTPAPEEPAKPVEEACAAEGCAEIGAAPSSPPADYQPPPPPTHQQSVSEQVSTMEWDVVASSGTLMYLVVTAITVLLFTLGHYYIEKMKRDGALVAKINVLQKELMLSTKECQILKDDLESTKDKISDIEVTTSDSSEAVAAIRAELSESQRVCQDQEEQIRSLEVELESATEAGLELNKMLSDLLSTQRGSEDLVNSVELLQSQLNKQQATISNMNQSLNAKTKENDVIRSELNAANDKVNNLEMEVAGVSTTLSELQMENERLKEEIEDSKSSVANQLQEAANLREMEVDGLKKKLDASEAKLAEVQNSLKYRDSELETLRESISKLEQLSDDNKGKANKKLEAMLDVSKAQAELKLLRSERDVLKERLQCEEDARQLLEDHVRSFKTEVEKLHDKGEAAEREKQDALTRLEVLSDYFKEKEAQLQKELGLQEAISVMKNEDVSVTQTKMKTLQEEINNYKAQNETLKQEILDQERSLKGQITTLEKKAHDNWIAARHAERKLEETKQESSTLRNRLTLLEKSPSLVTQNGEDGKGPTQRLLESNGDLAVSPVLQLGDSPTMSPHYMLPPPPPLGAFMQPPPPPPEYLQSPPLPPFADRRPPPLGRMSSPPPPHQFSPPPPNSADRFSSPYRPPRSPASDRSLPRYHRYSSRSPSPPPYGNSDYPPYHSAGRPWEEPRGGYRDKELKGSTVSSGHSSSDSLGKSSSHRSGKRGK